jgi:hypothetical protein
MREIRYRTDLRGWAFCPYVVVWEPKCGRGGGHQLVTDPVRADQLRWRMSRERPDDLIRVEHAEAFTATAVVERNQRRQLEQQA